MDFNEQLATWVWNFINDANNSTLDRASALAFWDIHFAETYFWATPQSGGGIHGIPPQ